MTPEEEDEARWLAAGTELTTRIDAAIQAILGRRVPFALLVWPHPNKTLFAGTASDATIRDGLASVLEKYDTMRFEVKNGRPH